MHSEKIELLLNFKLIGLKIFFGNNGNKIVVVIC